MSPIGDAPQTDPDAPAKAPKEASPDKCVNGGHIFEYVQALTIDDMPIQGVLSRDYSSEEQLVLWESQGIAWTVVPTSDLKVLNTVAEGFLRFVQDIGTGGDFVPGCLYTDGCEYIGLLKDHKFMSVHIPREGLDEPTLFHLTHIRSTDDVNDWVKENDKNVAFLNDDCEDRYRYAPAIGTATIIRVFQRALLPHMMTSVAQLDGSAEDGYIKVTPDPNDDKICVLKYFADKMTRTKHSFSTQWLINPREAGPVRTEWMWQTQHLPDTWPNVYTPEAYSFCIAKHLIERAAGEAGKLDKLVRCITPEFRSMVQADVAELLAPDVAKGPTTGGGAGGPVTTSGEGCSEGPVCEGRAEKPSAELCEVVQASSEAWDPGEYPEAVADVDGRDMEQHRIWELLYAKAEALRTTPDHLVRWDMIADVEALKVRVKEMLADATTAIVAAPAPGCPAAAPRRPAAAAAPAGVKPVKPGKPGKPAPSMHMRPLRFDQMDQLNRLNFCLDFAPLYNPETRRRICDVILVYNMHGYIPRMKNKYEQNNKNRGLCNTVRVFAKERITRSYNFDEETEKRITVGPDGKHHGLGRYVYRGIYKAPPGVETYKPKRPGKRKDTSCRMSLSQRLAQHKSTNRLLR